ncbi:NfeD family protein [Amycolatopsis sp. NPDC057786]|uniref:NfeD family protein n=1 Tax=Amycolatopsis sp. NPDC057786 TaxID=3346250 RepID=UPI00366C9328
MTGALIWLIAGILLIIAELLSGDLFLLMVGVGALFGAGSAALTGNPFIDVAVFAVASVGMLVLVRPTLKRRFLAGPDIKTNTEALIGARAIVVSTVDGDTGQVKLAGDVWSARCMTDGEPIAPGTSVTVVEISGATAVVSAEL